MTPDAVDLIIQGVIQREGDYVEHADDHGGATRYGVTLKTLSAWRGIPCTSDDVRNLSATEAAAILRRQYVEQPGLNHVADPLLQELLVDISVNAGPGRAVQFLQTALELKPDGAFGPATRAALEHTVDVKPIYLKVLAQRAHHYAGIMSLDHSQQAFAAGWLNRVAEFIEKGA